MQLVAGYEVYQDFENYQGGVYTYDGSSELLGGHAVRVIGYFPSFSPVQHSNK